MLTLLLLGAAVTASAAMPFDVCTKSNNYLEAELARIYAKRAQSEKNKECDPPPSAPIASSEPLASSARALVALDGFSAECIYSSMKYVGMIGSFYWKCGENDTLIHDAKKSKPCLSEKYVSYVHESFLKAMACAKLSPYEVFPLISEESGFQVNIGRGGCGISQQNASAAAGINKLKLVEKLLADGGDDCKPALELMRKFDGTPVREVSPAAPCQYAALPYNPTLGLIYFAAFYKDARAKVEKALSSWPEDRYSTEELERITVRLTRMCYAAGVDCNEILHEFKSRTSSVTIPESQIHLVLSDVTTVTGKRAEKRKGQTAVFGGQTKELIRNFPYRIEKLLKSLGHSQIGESLGTKCSQPPEKAEDPSLNSAVPRDSHLESRRPDRSRSHDESRRTEVSDSPRS